MAKNIAGTLRVTKIRYKTLHPQERETTSIHAPFMWEPPPPPSATVAVAGKSGMHLGQDKHSSKEQVHQRVVLDALNAPPPPRVV